MYMSSRLIYIIMEQVYTCTLEQYKHLFIFKCRV